MRSCSVDSSMVIESICSLRGYDVDRMGGILREAEFIYLNGSFDVKKILPLNKDLGIVNDEGVFILKNRYIFPVKDMLGNVVALIGWYPDEKKYITTPSKLFSKDCLFYGMEQLSKTGRGTDYVITEGIFDSLSARACGLNCVAQMGITSSRYKEVLYTLFKNIIAVPDQDGQGRDVLLNDKWKIPRSGKYFRWRCEYLSMKDLDDFCKNFSKEDIQELFKEVLLDSNRVVVLEL